MQGRQFLRLAIRLELEMRLSCDIAKAQISGPSGKGSNQQIAPQ